MSNEQQFTDAEMLDWMQSFVYGCPSGRTRRVIFANRGIEKIALSSDGWVRTSSGGDIRTEIAELMRFHSGENVLGNR
jgi:hypothetical protein